MKRPDELTEGLNLNLLSLLSLCSIPILQQRYDFHVLPGKWSSTDSSGLDPDAFSGKPIPIFLSRMSKRLTDLQAIWNVGMRRLFDFVLAYCVDRYRSRVKGWYVVMLARLVVDGISLFVLRIHRTCWSIEMSIRHQLWEDPVLFLSASSFGILCMLHCHTTP